MALIFSAPGRTCRTCIGTVEHILQERPQKSIFSHRRSQNFLISDSDISRFIVWVLLLVLFPLLCFAGLPSPPFFNLSLPKLSDFFKPQRTQRIVSYLKNKIKSVSSLCSHAINTPAKILCCYHLMSAQSKAKKRGYSLVLSQISSVPSVVNRLFLALL